MFFKSMHTHKAAQVLLEWHYADRWCKKHVIPSLKAPGLAACACANLLWLSSRVPSRVHIANLRWQFNGFHTAARYQRKSRCVFCDGEDTEDRIEHFVICDVVQSLVPFHLKRGTPPRLPAKNFFLFGLDGKQNIGMALFILGLYTMHDEIRHHPDKTDFKKCFMRVCGEVHLRPCLQTVWRDISGWNIRQTPRLHEFMLAMPKCQTAQGRRLDPVAR